MISKIKVKYEDKKSRTYTNINPEAADANMRAVAELLTSMQTKTLASATRIDEKDLPAQGE